MYGFSLAVAAALAVVALFTLGSADTPKLSAEPLSFDGARAMEDVRTIATGFPQRVAGSEQDGRSTLWLIDELKQIGLEAAIESFPAERRGHDVGLQNVYAFDRGTMHGTIVMVANRDVLRSTTQGANDNATGFATLLGLARAFALSSHRHTLLFLWTDGDAEGGLGARNFVARHGVDDVVAVVALRGVGTTGATSIVVNGWSSTPRSAPPWLWRVTAPAARSVGAPPVLLPGARSQLLSLAAPLSGGLQAPFVAAGAPAVSLTAVGSSGTPPADTLDTVSGQTLAEMGSTVQRVVMTIDSAKLPSERSGGTIFLTRQRTLPGSSLAFLLAAFMLPLAAVTVDLYAHCRRERVALRHAWVRAVLGLSPWLAVLAAAYGANAVGLLPKGPGGVPAVTADLISNPRYLRVVLLIVAFALVALYTVAVERRVARRGPTDERAVVLVAHVSLLGIAAGLAALNVYSLLLVLPAALLWPLARPGRLLGSYVPAILGLSLLVVTAVHIAGQSGLGVDAWWYLFVLFETREVPVAAALLCAGLLSTTILYARALHAAPRHRAVLTNEALPEPRGSQDAEDPRILRGAAPAGAAAMHGETTPLPETEPVRLRRPSVQRRHRSRRERDGI